MAPNRTARPAPVIDEVALIPGSEPDTAVRVRLDPEDRATARLEYLAYNETLGWYRQRSFAVPRDMLEDLSNALRLARCMAPQCACQSPCAASRDDAPAALPFPGVCPAETPEPARRSQAS